MNGPHCSLLYYYLECLCSSRRMLLFFSSSGLERGWDLNNIKHNLIPNIYIYG